MYENCLKSNGKVSEIRAEKSKDAALTQTLKYMITGWPSYLHQVQKMFDPPEMNCLESMGLSTK